MDEKPRTLTPYHLAFDTAVLALSAVAAVEALDFPRLARAFPLVTACCATVVAAIVLMVDGNRYSRSPRASLETPTTAPVTGASNLPPDEIAPRRVLIVAAWILGYVAGIWVIGLPAATAVFLMACLLFEGRVRFWVAGLLTIVMMSWLLVFARLLGLHMPPSLFDLFSALSNLMR